MKWLDWILLNNRIGKKLIQNPFLNNSNLGRNWQGEAEADHLSNRLFPWKDCKNPDSSVLWGWHIVYLRRCFLSHRNRKIIIWQSSCHSNSIFSVKQQNAENSKTHVKLREGFYYHGLTSISVTHHCKISFSIFHAVHRIDTMHERELAQSGKEETGR